MNTKVTKKIITYKSDSKATTHMPLVSVIMPAHNAADFIAESIKSIINQTYTNWELVIVDDASTDATWQTITKFMKMYPQKIKATRLRKNINMGGDGAGNKAFQLTNKKSKYIARIDADDIAYSDRIERQVRYMEQHSQTDVIGSTATIIDDTGEVVGYKQVASTHQKIYHDFFKVHPMIHPTVMVRRTSLPDKKNMYFLKLNANNDYLTFSTLVCMGKKFKNLTKPLLYYRVHSSNDSLANIKRTLINTITIRWNMVSKQGYQPSLSGWTIFAAQTILALAPQKILFYAYMLSRGMYHPAKIWQQLRNRLTSITINEPAMTK